MKRVGIIDYGVGNLRSVEKGFEKVGVAAEVVPDPERIVDFEGLVLPGVGAFGDAMASLSKRGLIGPLLEYIEGGRPLLGICLGMQLLFSFSEEHGLFEGLAVIPGGVLRLNPPAKVPHMGWNVVNTIGKSPLFDGIRNGSRFYFVHSYFCAPAEPEWIVGNTPYAGGFPSAVKKENVYGLQFHPEKSSSLGLEILRNFGCMVGGER